MTIKATPIQNTRRHRWRHLFEFHLTITTRDFAKVRANETIRKTL
jgi:hypothetical protein